MNNCLSFYLWYLPESNRGHMDFQSIALPAELRHRAAFLSGAKICASLGLVQVFLGKYFSQHHFLLRNTHPTTAHSA